MKLILALYMILGVVTSILVVEGPGKTWSVTGMLLLALAHVLGAGLAWFGWRHADEHENSPGPDATMCLFGPALAYGVGWGGGVWVTLQ